MDQDLAADLAALSAELPDPLRLKPELNRFLDHPIARKWLFADKAGAQELRRFVTTSREPGLARVAAILLFQLDPDLFYPDFVRDLADYGRPTVEALESGIWLGRIDADRIAQDVVAAVKRTGNPAPLLLLQRPAARSVRDDLRRFIVRREMPLSLFGMYAYGYALEPDDRQFLADIAAWEDRPELASLAGLHLHKLGFPEAKDGIRRGLLAEDRTVRESTYAALSGLIPAATFERAGYRAPDEPSAQQRAVEILLDAI